MGKMALPARQLSHSQYIVEKIGRLRELRGFTIAELARRADMDRSHLGKVLRGDRGLRADEFLALCYALGASAEQFMPEDVRLRLAELNMRTPDGRPRI